MVAIHEVPPQKPDEDDGPDADTAPLSGGPPMLSPEKDHNVLAYDEEEADDDD